MEVKTKKIKKPDIYHSVRENGFYLIEPDEDAQGNELWRVSFKKSAEACDWEHIKSFDTRQEAKAYIDREIRRNNNCQTFAEDIRDAILVYPWGGLACSKDYRQTIADLILEDVMADIMASADKDNWNIDDVSMAVGRVLYKRLNSF